MTTKGIIVSLLLIIVLGGVVYLRLSKEQKVTAQPTGVTSQSEPATTATTASTTPAPSSTASSDKIVDYLVDGLVHDETGVAGDAIDGT